MARGALPNRQKRHRNAPSIPTRDLPQAGRTDPVPEPPEGFGVELGDAGRAWWDWAWTTSAAAFWHVPDDLGVVLSRAHIVDLLEQVEGTTPTDEKWAGGLTLDQIHSFIGRYLRIAGDLDKRLGLDPRARLDMRLEIVGGNSQAAPGAVPMTDEVNARRAEREAAAAKSV